MTQVYTTDDGTRIAYADEGEGQPLLCLPGLTHTMGDFDYLKPHLPPCRLIRLDYRGRGKSDFTGPKTYTVAQEAKDALGLLDHLGVDKAAVLGTSRGGIIGMFIAATAHDRLSGLCLNDVGPVVERKGLERIFTYIGRKPAHSTLTAMAGALPAARPEFVGVPPARWLDEARLHYTVTPAGLDLPYDPALRDAFAEAFEGPEPDLWPLFDAAEDLPVALIRGGNSDLLSPETVAEMRRRHPGMIVAEVPDRGHVPFLDEPEAVEAIHAFLRQVAG